MAEGFRLPFPVPGLGAAGTTTSTAGFRSPFPTMFGMAGVWAGAELPEVVPGGGGGKRRKYKRPRYYSEVDYVPQPEMAVRQFDPINESAMEDEETDDELILFLARVLH